MNPEGWRRPYPTTAVDSFECCVIVAPWGTPPFGSPLEGGWGVLLTRWNKVDKALARHCRRLCRVRALFQSVVGDEPLVAVLVAEELRACQQEESPSVEPDRRF